jgi:hypothetical protein
MRKELIKIHLKILKPILHKILKPMLHKILKPMLHKILKPILHKILKPILQKILKPILHKILFMYHRILLIHSTWDWTGASLLNILYSHMVSVLTYCKFLQAIVFYCAPIFELYK